MTRFDSISRLGLVMPSWVGDLVMATPAIRRLHAHRPDRALVALTRPGLSPLLRGLPQLEQVIEADPGGLAGPYRAGRRLADLDLDGVLLFPNSVRSGLIARCSGARFRIGWRRQGRGWLLSDAIPSPAVSTIRPTLEDYLELTSAITGEDPDGSENQTPHLVVTDEDRTAAAAFITAAEGPYAVLIPGANRLDKRWPVDRFARVADHLASAHGLRVAVSGSPTERSLADDLVAQASTPVINLAAGATGLGALKSILGDATLVISNDTGPRHVAAALATPLVSLFGPTDHRWTILPGVRERRLLAEPFLPEASVADRHAKTCRIDRISIEDVCDAVARQLESPSAT